MSRHTLRLVGFLLLTVALPLLTSTLVAQEADTAEPAPEEEALPTKVIHLDVEEWKWTPNRIRVHQGTKVVLKIHSYDATHRFDLKAYRLKVNLPQSKTTRVEFVADKAGTFTWRCGRPCGDGCPKLRGKLTVVERPAETETE